MTRRAPSQAGMTLVEILVTVVVLSILLSMVGAILVSALDTQKKVGATLFRERVGSSSLDLLSRDLGQVYAYDITDSFKGDDNRGSSGDADRIEFVTLREPAVKDPADEPQQQQQQQQQTQKQQLMQRFAGQQQQNPQQLPAREPLRLTKVSYFCKDSRSHPGLLTLFRGEQKFTPPPPSTTTATTTTGRTTGATTASTAQATLGELHVFEVFDRVRSFNLRYLQKDPQTQQVQWHDTWTDSTTIPVAVEVRLEIVPDPRADAEARAMGIDDRTRKVYPALISVETTIPAPPQQMQQATQPAGTTK